MKLQEIRKQVERLRSASPRPPVFGAGLHQFQLHPPLSERAVAAFEAQHQCRLPAEYRSFLTEVGNGGAGPYYGLFKLGERMDLRSLVQWREDDGVVGTLRAPFPHTGPWNDLTGEPTEDDEENDDFYQRMAAFEERYFSPRHVDGAVPVADLGCALGHWLVVTGPEAGNIWCDFRADRRGIVPLSRDDGARVTFLQWYCDWLTEALRQLTTPAG
jgi:hypothetical protein